MRLGGKSWGGCLRIRHKSKRLWKKFFFFFVGITFQKIGNFSENCSEDFGGKISSTSVPTPFVKVFENLSFNFSVIAFVAFIATLKHFREFEDEIMVFLQTRFSPLFLFRQNTSFPFFFFFFIYSNFVPVCNSPRKIERNRNQTAVKMFPVFCCFWANFLCIPTLGSNH